MNKNNYRKFDLVVFGATGFTGQRVAMELGRVYQDEDIKWAVAGRNRSRLETMLDSTNLKDSCDILIADVEDEDSLLALAKQTRVVLNCVGPYRHYGEKVVAACVSAGCSHLDVCGEPQFLESMQQKYDEIAEQNGVYVIGACGFDSVPSDLGVEFTRKQIDGQLSAVDAYLDIITGPKSSVAHFATYESAVYGLGDVSTLRKLRQSINSTRLPTYGPKLPRHQFLFYKNELNKYAFPFPGADSSVVRRSQRYLHSKNKLRPVQFNMYFLIKSFFSSLLVIICGAMFTLLASKSWGQRLLLRYPKFFSGGAVSHEGPSEEQMEDTSFVLTLFGFGHSDSCGEDEKVQFDRKVTVKVAGPEPGYVATPIFMVQCGLIAVKEMNKLPGTGGVFTTASAFSNTTIFERLQNRGIVFKVVDKSVEN